MVSIIIVTYNSENYIAKLIESIFEFNKQNNFELIVVDNNSADKTLEEVNKLKRKIKVCKNDKNLGFAKGINSGAASASGDYLIFINPDCIWKQGGIDSLKETLDRDDRVGIVGGKLVGEDGVCEKSAGRFFGVFECFCITLGIDERMGIRFCPENTRTVDFVSGGFMMVRKSLFKNLSGFDEKLFMYVEDMEFCFRAKLAGFLTLATDEVVLEHQAHGSSSRSFAVASIIRGILYFHKKHGTTFSYSVVKVLLYTKAGLLVLAGKILNNKYLSDAYSQVFKS